MSEKFSEGAASTVSNQRAFIAGMIEAAPIVFGFIPIGIAFGVLANKAGLSDTNILLLSMIVYAGSSQFIAVSLMEANVPAISIILTTFIVNLRHLLMSAALAPYLGRWRRKELAAFAFHLTDETFALHSIRFPRGVPPKAQVFGLNATVQVAWVLGTWLGITLGGFIGEVEPWGLDFALPAMFVALLAIQVKGKVQISVAALAGLLSVALVLSGMGRWNVILATFIGASIGTMVDTWIKT